MKRHIHREPLTSDIIFKAVFGQDTPDSKAALIEMLNLILEYRDDPIVNLIYLNPFSIVEAENEKTIVMDVKVETSKGELVDIEMQIGELRNYVKRSVFYGCKQITKGLERGDDYVKMKKSIVISFINSTLFPQDIPVHYVYMLYERETGIMLTDVLELHYIELGKIELHEKSPEEMDPIEQLGAYLKCSGRNDSTELVEALVQKGEKVISMADKVLRKISEEERLQAIREDREMAEIIILMDKTTAREDGLAEGRAEGITEGRAEGIAEGITKGEALQLISLIGKKVSKGNSLAQIADILETSEDEIKGYYTLLAGNPEMDPEEVYNAIK